MQAFSTDALLHLRRLGSSAWGPYCLAAMPIVYFAFFLYFLAIGYYQQHSRPVYHDLRAAVILFRLQVRAGHSSGLCLISSASCSQSLQADWLIVTSRLFCATNHPVLCSLQTCLRDANAPSVPPLAEY